MLVGSCLRVLVVVVIGIFAAAEVPRCSAQSSKVRREAAPLDRSGQAAPGRSDIVPALEVLMRLRAARDCWNDPYMVVVGDDSRFENEGLYLRCDQDYRLRLLEVREAVGRALASIRHVGLRREISAAMAVLNDLDTVTRLFNSRTYFFSQYVRVTDIFPIVRKYSIPYREDRISKETVYRALVPVRRPPIDKLAALIPDASEDPNPTLTSEQAEVAADDLDWSIASRLGQGYDWYLRRHPRGRHVAEARNPAERKATGSEETEHLKAISEELSNTTHAVIGAFIRGDRTAFEQLLAISFPDRARYIERLQPQEVLSFEIKYFRVQIVNNQKETYQAEMDIQYKGLLGKRREYHNRITYARRAGGWQILDWRSL